MNGYVKYFDSNNKYMKLLVHDKELLKKYNAIWDEISNLLKKYFDIEPVYNGKYIKAKINLYNNKINFHGNTMLEENECYMCFTVLLLLKQLKISTDNFRRMKVCNQKNIINDIKEELNLN